MKIMRLLILAIAACSVLSNDDKPETVERIVDKFSDKADEAGPLQKETITRLTLNGVIKTDNDAIVLKPVIQQIEAAMQVTFQDIDYATGGMKQAVRFQELKEIVKPVREGRQTSLNAPAPDSSSDSAPAPERPPAGVAVSGTVENPLTVALTAGATPLDADAAAENIYVIGCNTVNLGSTPATFLFEVPAGKDVEIFICGTDYDSDHTFQFEATNSGTSTHFVHDTDSSSPDSYVFEEDGDRWDADNCYDAAAAGLVPYEGYGNQEYVRFPRMLPGTYQMRVSNYSPCPNPVRLSIRCSDAGTRDFDPDSSQLLSSTEVEDNNVLPHLGPEGSSSDSSYSSDSCGGSS